MKTEARPWNHTADALQRSATMPVNPVDRPGLFAALGGVADA